MLMKWLIVLLVAAGPQGAATQLDVFKKDMVPLQSAVDSLVTSTGAQVTPSGRSHAAYIEGYGVIVTLEIAFEAPQGIFDTPKKPAEVRTLVAKRQKEVKDKLSAFITQRVTTTDSIGPTDSLAVVVHVLNTTPADIPNLPIQIVMSAKKDAPQQVAFRQF
jgi:hypothetical protein